MEKVNYHIKLAIDPHFLGHPFAEKLKAEPGEKGLEVEIETEPSKWSEPYSGLNGNHNDRGLFTIEVQSLLLEPSSESIQQVLPELIEKWLSFFNEQLNNGELGFGKMLELLRLRPICVYYLEGKHKLHFTNDLSLNKEKFIEQWRRMMELIAKTQT